MDRFTDVLKASNLKSTHQRLSILHAIDIFGHVDIDTLYEAIVRKCPTMSKATLYRNINDLISFHILEEVKLPNQKQQYEIKKVTGKKGETTDDETSSQPEPKKSN